MTIRHRQQDIAKGVLSEELHGGTSALASYRNKVLGGRAGIGRLLQYELAQLLVMNMGGGLGYLLRRLVLASLFETCGKGVIFGKGLMLRKPGQIRLGDRVALDDGVLLDGGLEEETAVIVGSCCMISRGCVLQAKTRPLVLGAHCDIGVHTVLSSIGGIELGDSVLIAGNCYIGGGRYHTDRLDVPIMLQGVYSRGPVRIGEGTWIGAAATILDGVAIGRGCVVGAGSLVTKDLADYSVAVGVPARVVSMRREPPDG